MSFVNPAKNKFGHFTVIFAVVCLQLLLVILFEHSLSTKLSEVTKSSITARLIEEFKKTPVPPPPPPPKPQKVKKIEPQPFVPKPEISRPVEIIPEIHATAEMPVEVPVKPPVVTPTVQVTSPIVAYTPPKPDPVVILGKLDASAGCEKPEYPQPSLNAQEEGVVVLSFLIDANSTVKESRVEKTSGFKRLDNAARDALSLCKFKAGTENGKPVASWVKIKYAWQLN